MEEEDSNKQMCVTAFFKPCTGNEGYKTVWEKDEAERLAKIEKEKQKAKDEAKEKRKQMKEKELKEIEERQKVRDDASKKKIKEKEAKYEGIQIIENLYLGGRLAAMNSEWLEELNVRHILNCSVEVKCYYEKDENYKYLRIPIEDKMEESITEHFESACIFIDDALSNNRPVLVHCKEGKSRSVSFVVAYLMTKKEKSLGDAYKLIKENLPWEENINIGFKTQLMNVELKKSGRDQLEFGISERRSRRSSQRVNYCELDEKKPRRKKKEVVQKTPLESFEVLWKKILKEKSEFHSTENKIKSAEDNQTKELKDEEKNDKENKILEENKENLSQTQENLKQEKKSNVEEIEKLINVDTTNTKINEEVEKLNIKDITNAEITKDTPQKIPTIDIIKTRKESTSVKETQISTPTKKRPRTEDIKSPSKRRKTETTQSNNLFNYFQKV